MTQTQSRNLSCPSFCLTSLSSCFFIIEHFTSKGPGRGLLQVTAAHGIWLIIAAFLHVTPTVNVMNVLSTSLCLLVWQFVLSEFSICRNTVCFIISTASGKVAQSSCSLRSVTAASDSSDCAAALVEIIFMSAACLSPRCQLMPTVVYLQFALSQCCQQISSHHFLCYRFYHIITCQTYRHILLFVGLFGPWMQQCVNAFDDLLMLVLSVAIMNILTYLFRKKIPSNNSLQQQLLCETTHDHNAN